MNQPNFSSATTPWIGVDLDGTLAEQYWPRDRSFHPLIIGRPIPAMVTTVKALLAAGWTVKIFTARVGAKGPADTNKGVKRVQIHKAIFDWTLEHLGVGLEATCTKDYNMVALYDDRAYRIVHNKGRLCCGVAPYETP